MAFRDGRTDGGASGGGQVASGEAKSNGGKTSTQNLTGANVPSAKDAMSTAEKGTLAPATPQPAAEKPIAPARRGGKAKRVLAVLLLAGVSFGGYQGYHWWTEGRFIERTDDAYVNADITTILSKVSGYVATVAVEDNQVVHAGDVLLRIDDGDYRLAVQSARDAIASAKATVARIDTQIVAGQASVLQAKASVEAAAAQAEEAEANFNRQKKLAQNSFASVATLDTAEARMKQAKADLASAQAAVTLAKANIDVLNGQKKEAEQAVASAQTALQKAERDLDFTVVRAPVDGIVGNRAAQVGSLLQAGSRIAAIVPLADTHIDANFKETQLGDIQPGAEVEISVDAYPDNKIRGVVESIAPATGSVFSLLPTENATGNFTKVVQRVPVKIRVSSEEAATGHLRAGMSVIVEVDTRTNSTKGEVALSALR